jgi:CrcB protein
MRELMLVALGGAVGSVARVVTSGAVYRLLPATYPWGTTAVNIAGSFLFGLVVGVGITRGGLSPDARALILSGLLGGFTTFSAFSFETVELMATGYTARALVNIVSQVALGAAALWLGLTLTRS